MYYIIDSSVSVVSDNIEVVRDILDREKWLSTLTHRCILHRVYNCILLIVSNIVYTI